MAGSAERNVNNLLRYFSTSSEKNRGDEKKRKDTATVSESESEEASPISHKKTRTELDAEPQRNPRPRKFQPQWKIGRPWLNYSEETKSMSCSYCTAHNEGRRDERSALASKEGCTTFRLETLKKHEVLLTTLSSFTTVFLLILLIVIKINIFPMLATVKTYLFVV